MSLAYAEQATTNQGTEHEHSEGQSFTHTEPNTQTCFKRKKKNSNAKKSYHFPLSLNLLFFTKTFEMITIFLQSKERNYPHSLAFLVLRQPHGF